MPKKNWLIAVVIAIGTSLLLVGWALAVCAGLGFLFTETFGFPIEPLAVIAFFLYEVGPIVLILGVIYSMVVQRLRGPESSAHYMLRALGLAAVSLIIIIAIFFPCDAEPYHIGGFVIKLLFGGP